MQVIPLKLPTFQKARNMKPEQLVTVPNHWFIHLLKGNMENTPLALFQKVIAPAAEIYFQLIQKTNSPAIRKQCLHIVEKLWSSFPTFCIHPAAGATIGHIIKPLCNGIKKNNSVTSHILVGLSTYVSTKQQKLKEKDLDSNTEKQCLLCLSELGNVASKVLPILFNQLLASDNFETYYVAKNFLEKKERILDCIDHVASTIEMKQRNNIFKTVLQRLLESQNSQAEALLDIVYSLATHLDSETIALLWRYLKTQLTQSTGIVQKKVYRIVGKLFGNDSLGLPQTLELLNLIVHLEKNQYENSEKFEIKSKRPRLNCLKNTIQILTQKSRGVLNREMIQIFLAEIIVYVKDSNLKVRDDANDVLLALSNLCQLKGEFEWFINQILAGLVTTDPYYQSGSIVAISRVLYAYTESKKLSNDSIHRINRIDESQTCRRKRYDN
eukprot:UN31177